MIKLGGNIKLDGFDNIEHAKLVVIKKMVGTFVKELEPGNSVSLSLNLNGNFNVNAELVMNNITKTSSKTEKNLFFAVNEALKDLKTQ